MPRRSATDKHAICVAAERLGMPHRAHAAIETFNTLMEAAALAREPIVTRKHVTRALNSGRGAELTQASKRTERTTVTLLEQSGLIRPMSKGPNGASRWHLHLLAQRLCRSEQPGPRFWGDMKSADRRRRAAKQRRRYWRLKGQVSQNETTAKIDSGLKEVSDTPEVEIKKTLPGLILKALQEGQDPESLVSAEVKKITPEKLGEDLPSAQAEGRATPKVWDVPAFVPHIKTDELEDIEQILRETQPDTVSPLGHHMRPGAVSNTPTVSHTEKAKAGSQGFAWYDSLSEQGRQNWDKQPVTSWYLGHIRPMLPAHIAQDLDIRRLKVQGRKLRNRDLRKAALLLKDSPDYTIGQLVWRAQRFAMLNGHRRDTPITTEV